MCAISDFAGPYRLDPLLSIIIDYRQNFSAIGYRAYQSPPWLSADVKAAWICWTRLTAFREWIQGIFLGIQRCTWQAKAQNSVRERLFSSSIEQRTGRGMAHGGSYATLRVRRRDSLARHLLGPSGHISSSQQPCSLRNIFASAATLNAVRPDSGPVQDLCG